MVKEREVKLWLTPREREARAERYARAEAAALPWGVYEPGALVQLARDPARFGVVVSGLRRFVEQDAFYARNPDNIDRIAVYGYSVRVRWGSRAFERDSMDDDAMRTVAESVKDIAPAAPEAADLLTKMLGDGDLDSALAWGTWRFDELRLALRGPLRPLGFFPSRDSHQAMVDCEERGWLRRTTVGGAVRFEITDAGRRAVEALDGAVPPA